MVTPSTRSFRRSRHLSITSLCIAGFLALFTAAAASADFTNEECMSCHGDASKVKKVFDTDQFADTQHEDTNCTECHVGITKLDHDKVLPKVDCTVGCHEDQAAEYNVSVHALSKVTIPELVTNCWSCHETHRILGKKNKKSRVHRSNVAETCATCHTDKRLLPLFFRRGVEAVADYKRGSHFSAADKLLNGDKKPEEKKVEAKNGEEKKPEEKKSDKKPATCMDCHGAHKMLAPGNLESSINKFQIPKTCGKCHEKERDEYFQSTHWQSLQRGNYEMPVCNDCHGEHSNMLPGAREPSMTPALASSELCANCHSNRVLMERFGLDAGRFATYMKTYHGMAVLRGSEKAPSCTSCHGKHAIRGQTDPLSSTHKNNLEKTCGECHKNANGEFVQISVHPKDQRDRNPVAYYVRLVYIWLIFLLVGGMLLHNLIILSYYLRDRWFGRKLKKREKRFTRFQIIQHFLLIVSFTLLAISGFALKFPDAWWVEFLTSAGLHEVERSIVHRISGVLLIIVSIVQLIYFAVSQDGRKEVLALVPTWADVVSCVETLGYFLRITKKQPEEYGRYDYTEKAEYLALIWGTLIMAVSGFVLWFPEFFLKYLPIWSFELSEVIHYFEAILAVAAIFVWHMFFTVFHPKHHPAIESLLEGQKLADEAEEAAATQAAPAPETAEEPKPDPKPEE